MNSCSSCRNFANCSTRKKIADAYEVAVNNLRIQKIEFSQERLEFLLERDYRKEASWCEMYRRNDD